jgi:hypothetical protein
VEGIERSMNQVDREARNKRQKFGKEEKKIDRRIEEGEGEWVVEVAHIQDEIHKVEKDQEHLYTSQ